MSRHSNDLRKRVVDFFNSSQKIAKTKTAKTFQISRQTLDDWLELDKEGKLFEVSPNKGGFASKIDTEELKLYFQRHPDAYDREAGIHFGASDETIRRIRHKLKITVKKNKPYTQKQMKNKDQPLSKKSQE